MPLLSLAAGEHEFPTSLLLMSKKKLQNNVKKLPTKTEKACQKVADQNRKIAGCLAGSRLQMTTLMVYHVSIFVSTNWLACVGTLLGYRL